MYNIHAGLCCGRIMSWPNFKLEYHQPWLLRLGSLRCLLALVLVLSLALALVLVLTPVLALALVLVCLSWQGVCEGEGVVSRGEDPRRTGKTNCAGEGDRRGQKVNEGEIRWMKGK